MTSTPSQEHSSAQDEEPRPTRLTDIQQFLQSQIERVPAETSAPFVIHETFRRRPGDLINELRDTDSRFLCALMSSSPELEKVLGNSDTYATVTVTIEPTRLSLTLVDCRNCAIRLDFDDIEQRATVSLGEVDDDLNVLRMSDILQHELTDGQSKRLIRDIESVGTMMLHKRSVDETQHARDARRRVVETQQVEDVALVEQPDFRVARRAVKALARLSFRSNRI